MPKAYALEQLQNIHRSLADDWLYICITPNRLDGPHDVSQYFDGVARGFHMKEYTTAALARLSSPGRAAVQTR